MSPLGQSVSSREVEDDVEMPHDNRVRIRHAINHTALERLACRENVHLTHGRRPPLPSTQDFIHSPLRDKTTERTQLRA